MKNTLYLLSIALLVVSCNTKKTVATTKKAKTEIKSIAQVTKKSKKSDGLFPIYQDSTTGEIYLEVDENQLNKEYIYFSYIENGIVDARLNRGAYRGSKIFKFVKNFNKIEVQLPNTSYYFDSTNEISKSSQANINTPIAVSEKIAGKTGSKYLIKGDALFMNENFAPIKPSYPPGYKGFKLGKLSSGKSSIQSIRNYPNNTDVRTRYVYENSGISARGSSATTDGRFISISYHHSFLEVPKNEYKPRYDDPRVGYFTTSVTDLTSDSPTPYKDLVHRWNLVKKNPEAAISEPVEPITWWIENTTPKELRPIIKEGVESWNEAFEKAGFKNAVVVNIQPDDATWDAGDIRYNVLRWTSSPNPPFGGYGPSFVNPRTGQILGADIMLEYVYILGRMKQEKYYDIAGLSSLFTEETNEHNHKFCSAGSMMQQEVLFANSALQVTDLSGIEKNKFLTQSLKRLVLHEVGHTLGLNHNMKGSTIQSLANIKNKKIIEEQGLCNSVMEYPAINFALDKSNQTMYYDDKPGFYDHWAIEFAYSTALADEDAEKKRLDKILQRSHEPMLVFGNDADDMRSPGKGIDPMVNIYDLSNDPVGYAIERIQLVDDTLVPSLLSRFKKDNQSYSELRSAYLTLTGQKAIQLGVITRQIGGVYVNRAFEGQPTTTRPYTPVPYEKQKAAVKALSTYAFAPNAFDIDPTLAQYLQQQRRGFNFFSKGEDPRIHERALKIHKSLFNHLLHQNVLNRLVNTSVYGNTYKLSEYMTDLTDAVFASDKSTAVNHIRQNLQLEYTTRLISYLDNKQALLSTKSQALFQLYEIQKIAKISSADTATNAHRKHLALLIEKALKA